MPPPEQFAAAMADLGVGEGTRVVLYDRAMNIWAARVWWMLRAVGFDAAAVLNGGFPRWTLEGRPVSTAPCPYPRGRFVARPRPELFGDKSAVLAGLGERATCVLNALTEEQHRGPGGVTYGRPGRIAGSVNVAVYDASLSEWAGRSDAAGGDRITAATSRSAMAPGRRRHPAATSPGPRWRAARAAAGAAKAAARARAPEWRGSPPSAGA